MALYFDSLLDCPSGSAVVCMSWHHKYEVIAVGLSLPEGKGGLVNFFNKQVNSIVSFIFNNISDTGLNKLKTFFI